MLIVDAHLDLAYNALRGRDVHAPGARAGRGQGRRPRRRPARPCAGGVGLICATIFCQPRLPNDPGYRTPDEAHAHGATAITVVSSSSATRARSRSLLVARVLNPCGTRSKVRVTSTGYKPVPRLTRSSSSKAPTRSARPPTSTVVRRRPAHRRPRVEADALRRRDRRARPAHARGRRARPRARPLRHHPRRLAPGRGIVLATARPRGGPVIASHSNCRAIVPTDRQLSDEMIRAIAATRRRDRHQLLRQVPPPARRVRQAPRDACTTSSATSNTCAT